MEVSVRVEFCDGKRWFDLLKEYEGFNLEIAFYQPETFLKTDILSITEPIISLRSRVESLHMAHAPIIKRELFLDVLKKTLKISKDIGCDTIICHPSKAEIEDVKSFLEDLEPLLEEDRIYLCWETFLSKKRFFSGIEQIVDFCKTKNWQKVCFDFSHTLDSEDQILRELDRYSPYIHILHVSNRIKDKGLKHLPVFYDKEERLDLDFNKIFEFLNERNYKGKVTLEYLPVFCDYLKRDVQRLLQKFKD